MQKGTKKEPNIEACRVPNGTFETHSEDLPGPRSQSPAASTRAAEARPGRSQPGRPPLDPSSGTACKKGPKKSRTLRLAGCLTVPSKPTKKTRQGLAARALQQAQEQLRHGQGAAKPRRTQAQWHGVEKGTEKEPKIEAWREPKPCSKHKS